MENQDDNKRISGYGKGEVDSVISVEEVVRQTQAIAEDITQEKLDALVDGEPFVILDNLTAGYGKMQILHNTILHAIFGFNNIFSGKVLIGEDQNKRDVTKLSPNEKLSQAGIAYILQ